MNQDIHQQIDHYTRQLRLPGLRQTYLELAKTAAKEKQSYEQYLLGLMKLEADQRTERRKKQRVRRAGFPAQKLLQGLIVAELPLDGADKLPSLERLDFITEGQNLILAGNPGTGKTHIATGLGIKACLADLTVLFTTVPRLITQVIESRSEKTRRQLEGRLKIRPGDL